MGYLPKYAAGLAGDRFHNACRNPIRPAGVLPLRPFPDEPDHTRLTRWLDRRKALLFVGWYVLVFVPLLILIVLATQFNELLGIAVLVVGVLAIGAVTLNIRDTFGGCRDLVDRAAVIDGSDLVVTIARQNRTNLHSGRITVLRPGTLKGYGKGVVVCARRAQGESRTGPAGQRSPHRTAAKLGRSPRVGNGTSCLP